MGNEWGDLSAEAGQLDSLSQSSSHGGFLLKKTVRRQDSAFTERGREKCVGCFSFFHQIPVTEKRKGINSAMLQ